MFPKRLPTMLHSVVSSEFTDVEFSYADADPMAARLAHALEGCKHPRAGRLLRWLCQHPCDTELAKLQAEVQALLTMSFGAEEARRRLG